MWTFFLGKQRDSKLKMYEKLIINCNYKWRKYRHFHWKTEASNLFTFDTIKHSVVKNNTGNLKL